MSPQGTLQRPLLLRFVRDGKDELIPTGKTLAGGRSPAESELKVLRGQTEVWSVHLPNPQLVATATVEPPG